VTDTFAFLVTFLAFVVIGLLFAATGYGAADSLRRACRLPGFYTWPFLWLINAVAGYAVFFAFVRGPVVGVVASGVVMGGLLAWTAAGWKGWRNPRRRRVGIAVGATILLAGILYFADLWGAANTTRFVQLPEGRYLEHKLPGDNVIPYWVAHYVLDQSWGEELFDADNLQGWLISDRPPLQAGVYLFYFGVIKLMGMPTSTGYQLVGMILQLIWIPGFWLLAKRFVPGRIARRLLFLMLGMGMVVVNMAYIWPKMVCAGFVLFGIALVMSGSRRKALRLILGAVAFALGLLSHGGALFTAPAFGLAFVRQWWRKLPTGMALGMATAVVMLGPWMAFQKIVAPPGNNLLKWHLAGQFYPADNSLRDALVEGYGKITLEEALDNRWQNLVMLIGVHETHRPDFSSSHKAFASMKRMQWFLVLPSAGFLWLGILGYLMRRPSREPPRPGVGKLWELPIWVAASFAFWILLVYEGGEVFMHHGSYATMLLLYLWLGIGAALGGVRLFAVVTLLQAVVFLAFWWWPYGTIVMAEGGQVVWLPMLIALGVYGCLAWWLWKPVRRNRG